MTTDIKFSVIVPLAPNESSWKELLDNNLCKLPDGAEVIFVAPQGSDLFTEEIVLANKDVHCIIAPTGRAQQMNAGAMKARGDYLWFLHADSKFADDTVSALEVAVEKYPNSLLYFDLAFLNDAAKLVKINEWGAYFRSRVLKVPFGDQGFCIKKDLFKKLGTYPEGLDYGEDHIFVWRAHQHSVTVQHIGAKLYTSARKYKKNGWLKTTLVHIYLTIKQAWPEIIKTFKERFK